ncbi:TetR/AcrR family transcriptional regulator [Variovorax dokdonensis]|uniref:TetR/AcrR family transcriptional regulator n=1 Tax=Variovorax dokdonensis TaxID=344883 RepID=A0ABT7N7M0_9BURK|nr:TetR/AcrR family transcriptional regulator [Variovorax dokdonensis]MDM0043907.1 TetR/AcrR family transcriptional regulator [Variovorax dokdonensis]
MKKKTRSPSLTAVAKTEVVELGERAVEKKQRIVDAGLRVFVEDGFRGASMDRIATEAAVSKPTIYRYFESKEHLFEQILRGVSDRMLLPVEHARDDAAPVEAILCQVAGNAAEVVLSDDVIALQRLVTAELTRFPDLAHGFFQNGPKRAITGFGKMLRECRDAGELEIDDLNVAAHQFWSLTIGMPHRTKLIDPDWSMTRTEVRKWIASGVKSFLKLYGVQAAGRRAGSEPKLRSNAAS